MDPRSELLTIKEVAAAVRVPEATLQYWRGNNKLPPGFPDGTKIGKRVMYRRVDIEAWIDGRFEPAIAPPASVAPAGAVAAARYFPWADFTDVIASIIAENCAGIEDTVISNAVWAAMDAAYETYMAGLGRRPHVDAEADAVIAVRETLEAHLHPAQHRHAEAG
jgi:predicted DNA-binding transcriptional regulator AlpA